MLQSPQEIEMTIEDAGGVPVVIGEVSTWGHIDIGTEHGFGSGTGADSTGGRSAKDRIVTVAALDFPALVEGAAITVDGVAEQVRAFRPDSDGSVIRILLANHTHVIDVLKEQPLTATSRGRRRSSWEVVEAGVRCSLEPVSADLVPEAGGQRAAQRWRGFIPRGIPMAANQGVVNTSGGGPARFRVISVADHGSGWDLVVELVSTEEVFP